MDETPDLRLGLMTRIFAVLAVVFVATLAIAPARSALTEWRDVQGRYDLAAAAVGSDPAAKGIQQIWNRELGVVDRCTSCHLGMGPADPLAEHPVFGPHPEIPHDPEEYACTPCHAGQGRATRMEAAHGHVAHWFEPLLAREHLEAGCGSCHSAIPVGRLAVADRGRALFARSDCLACHRVEGRGGGRAAPEVMPDLSGIGLAGVPADWHQRHLELRERDPQGLIAECYGPLDPDEVEAIGEYLGGLVAMPRLSHGKRLFHERGCRGCHQVNGVGGTEGPDLSGAGLKTEEELVFPADFPGERSLASWHVRHLMAPAEVVEDSLMPDQALDEEEAEAISLYLLSLRKAELSGEYWPSDRVRVDRLGEREFGTDGETLIQVFCAACHGTEGEGLSHGSVFTEAVPAIASPDLLAVASDAFLRRAVEEGRPSRRMPAWGAIEGGLRPDEIRRVVEWLRAGEPEPPDLAEVATGVAPPGLGELTYAASCAVCHGPSGEGGIGPSLRSPALLSLASDGYLYETITEGRPGTAMPRFRELPADELRGLIDHLRGLSGEPVTRVDLEELAPRHGDPERGAAVWRASCAACHGEAGEGGPGPAIGKRGFLRAAEPGFAAESFARGRCRDRQGNPPPALAAQELADAIAWLEERAEHAEDLAGRRVEGDPGNGERIWRRACAGCHGAAGEGKEGPALADLAFLQAANDGFLQATIVRGRRGTAMPSFDRDGPDHPRLSAGEIDDTVAFIRSLAGGKEQD